MEINLEIFGLILNFVGSFVLILVSIFRKWYQKDYSKY
jgi:hypothetical protein